MKSLFGLFYVALICTKVSAAQVCVDLPEQAVFTIRGNFDKSILVDTPKVMVGGTPTFLIGNDTETATGVCAILKKSLVHFTSNTFSVVDAVHLDADGNLISGPIRRSPYLQFVICK